MNKLVFFFVFCILTSCSNTVSKDNLKFLNGYWEIEHVSFPDGSEKKYSISTTIEYIQLEGQEGFRKKVQPKLDGTYDTSNDAISYTLTEKDGVYKMIYKNNLSQWDDQITSLTQTKLSLVTKEKIIYTYKRFQPINVTN